MTSSDASSDHLAMVLYIGFAAGITPMMYFLSFPEFRIEMMALIQKLKFMLSI